MIVSLQNPLVKHAIKLKENRKYRDEQGLIFVSGFKNVQEISEICPPQTLFVTDLKHAINAEATYVVSEAVIKKMTGLVTPEPIAALFSKPKPSPLKNHTPILALDALQDPGNVGTLIRTALALKFGGVLFLPGTVDPFNEKVIRSSRGALFKLPWLEGNFDDLSKLREEGGFNLYIADTSGTPIHALSLDKKVIIILGNEANGVNPQMKAQGEHITIPMHESMESLNVAIAGAIIMYHLQSVRS